MKKSKYLGKSFGNWKCTGVSIYRTQGKYLNGTKTLSKNPYHQSYLYVFERVTSDDLANKIIVLKPAEAAKVYRGEMTVESIAEHRLREKSIQRSTYRFFIKD